MNTNFTLMSIFGEPVLPLDRIFTAPLALKRAESIKQADTSAPLAQVFDIKEINTNKPEIYKTVKRSIGFMTIWRPFATDRMPLPGISLGGGKTW